MKPHTCPVCSGSGKTAPAWQYETTAQPQPETCPACHGACVLWEPETATYIPTVWVGPNDNPNLGNTSLSTTISGVLS